MKGTLKILLALSCAAPASATGPLVRVLKVNAGPALVRPAAMAAPAAMAPAAGATVPGFGAQAPAPAASAEVPAPLPAAGVVPAAAAESLDALAPSKLENLSAESARGHAGRIFAVGEHVLASPETLGSFSFSAYADSGLEPSEGPAKRPAPEPAAPQYRPGIRERVAVRANFTKRWLQEYYWYSVTHIVNMWPAYKKEWKAAKEEGIRNISRPREFFTHMRTAGTTGRFYVLGVAPVSDIAVMTAFEHAFQIWFDGLKSLPGEGEEQFRAFRRLTDRALLFNRERRAPSNMRKHVRDALIKASTKRPDEMAAFFDSLLAEEKSAETLRFQLEGQQKVLEDFRKTVRETLDEEPRGAKGEVLAVILMGSFASASAGPKSDLDIELVTRGGKDNRVAQFSLRLLTRWIESGRQSGNPVGIHEHAYKPYRGVIDLVHSASYIVIARDAALAQRLQRRYDEKPKFTIDRRYTTRGAFGRAAQMAIIYASTFLGELKSAVGYQSSGH